LHFAYQGQRAKGDIVAGESWRIAPTDELLRSLRARLGFAAVRVQY